MTFNGNAVLEKTASVTFAANRTFVTTAGNAAVIDNGGFADVYGNGTTTGLNGYACISGPATGLLVSTGSGSLTILGNKANGFSGPTVVSAGCLSLFNVLVLGTDPTTYTYNQLQLDGGTFNPTATMSTSANHHQPRPVPEHLRRHPGAQRVHGPHRRQHDHRAGQPDRAGSGNVVLMGTGTFVGNTTAVSGIFTLDDAAAPTIGGNLVVSGGTVNWQAANQINSDGSLTVLNGTANLATFPDNVTGVWLGNGTSTGSIINTSTAGVLTSATTYNLESGSASAILAGANAGVGASKTTSGTVTLTGVDTFAGDTIVSAGILQLDSTGVALSGTGNVSVISGGDLVLQAGSQINPTANLTVNAGNLDMGGFTNTLANVTLTGNGNINSDGSTASVLTSSNTFNMLSGTASAGLAGTQGLAVNFTALQNTVTLSGNNTYSGGTTVTAGTLLLDNIIGGTSVPGNLTISGGTTAQLLAGNQIANTACVSVAGTFNVNGQTQGLNQLTGAGCVTLGSTSAGSLTVGVNNGSSEFDGLITGNGGLTQTGTGNFTLTGSDNFTGNTTVSGGNLILGNGAANGAVTGNVVDNANLAFDNASAQTVSNPISGSGNVAVAGSAPVTLTGNNTFSGTALVVSGGLVADGTAGNAALGSVTNLTVDAGTSAQFLTSGQINNAAVVSLPATATLSINGQSEGVDQLTGSGTVSLGTGGSLGVGLNNGSSEFDGAITGSGGLTQGGTGTFTLAGGGVSFSGTTTVSSGSLQLGNATTDGSVPGSIVDNGNVIFNDNGAAQVVNNAISGSGNVTAAGSQLLTIATTELYTGLTTVNSGATVNVTGSVAGNVTDNGCLGGSGSLGGTGHDVAVNGTLAPSLYAGPPTTLTVGGNLTFGAASYYQVVGNATASDEVDVLGSITITGGATLQLTQSGATAGTTYQLFNPTNGQSVTGSFSSSGGTLTNPGAGYVTLSGAVPLQLRNERQRPDAQRPLQQHVGVDRRRRG